MDSFRTSGSQLLITLVILLPALLCCKTSTEYKIDIYFDKESQDSLLVNMVTYIGRKPRTADFETRHDPVHRRFYILQANEFKFHYYHVSPDSIHYYYLIRPARSTTGNLRGVGGRFKIRQDLSLYEFEELFNTPVLPEEELITRGRSLFMEMIYSGNVDKYLENKDYIEWPDERLKYDKIKNEWRYDVIQ